MTDNISFYNQDELEESIQKVVTQTNYTREEAIEKLKLFNCDFIRVIKDYLNITDAPPKRKPRSVNQEIFYQIRTTLDKSMKEYRDSHEIDITQVINNLQESELREQKKLH